MTDLTKLTAPFGLLDEVYGEGTKEALKAHGGPYECYCDEGYWINISPHWGRGTVYRVKPQPPTKPNPPWEHLADWVQYVAREEDGSMCAFEEMPEDYVETGEWDISGQSCCLKSLNFDPGTCDWRDSLVKRPEDK